MTNHSMIIKAFDLNSRETNPTGVAYKNPADSFLLTFNDNDKQINILNDAGKPSQLNNYIIPYLKEKSIGNLDYFVLSHHHIDHFGGILDLLQNDEIKVNHMLIPDIPIEALRNSMPEEAFDIWAKIETMLINSETKVCRLKTTDIGKIIKINEHSNFKIIDVHVPDKESTSIPLDLNEYNLIFKINYHKFTGLFAGDCGHMQSHRVLSSEQMHELKSITFLKASHHGGDFSFNKEFIDTCDSKVVVIPCNDIVVEKRPSFISNLHYYSRNGAKIFRLDRSKNLVIKTDGETIKSEYTTEFYRDTTTMQL